VISTVDDVGAISRADREGAMSLANMRTRSILAGVGAYLPEKIVTNDDLSLTIDTSDAWINERTGIRQRHFAAPHETCAFMGTAAARAALDHAGIAASEVGALILGTSTPDQAFPATAVRVQAAIGAAGSPSTSRPPAAASSMACRSPTR